MSRADADFDYTQSEMPPAGIFVSADEPLLVFPSKQAAERFLEVYDIEAGVYPVAYGRGGEVFSVTVEGEAPAIQPVAGEFRPEELKQLLVHYLGAIGLNPDSDRTLDQLVEDVWDHEREFWAENDPYGERFSKRVPVWGCVAILALIAAIAFTAGR
jgi:hypothetical protein